MQLGDHLVEEKLGCSASCTNQDRAELSAWHLDLSIFILTSPHACHSASGIVNEDQLADVGPCLFQSRENTEALGDVIGALSDVDRVSAGSNPLITLHDSCLMACSPQQRSQGRTGDSGS